VSDLGLYFMTTLTRRASILGVQFHKVCDLGAEAPDLFAKHFDMIHNIRIAHLAAGGIGVTPIADKN
jgi:hypothetical protein